MGRNFIVLLLNQSTQGCSLLSLALQLYMIFVNMSSAIYLYLDCKNIFLNTTSNRLMLLLIIMILECILQYCAYKINSSTFQQYCNNNCLGKTPSKLKLVFRKLYSWCVNFEFILEIYLNFPGIIQSIFFIF